MDSSSKLRIVIKIGSSSLVTTVFNQKIAEKETFLSLHRIAAVIETIVALRREGHEIVLVSSGAVGTGCHCLGLNEKPSKLSLSQRQALAAVGQVHLMAKYESLFAAFKQNCAQVLLTYDTFNSKTQYLNASNTFRELFNMGVIPIVNENDTVATQELQSDNDTLAALVSSLVGADALFLLTDVDGLYTSNPIKNHDAELIEFVKDITKLDSICQASDGKSAWGTGGMSTKVAAARLASSMGVETTVLNATRCLDILKYASIAQQSEDRSGRVPVGTTFAKGRNAPRQHKRWIRGLRCRGKVVVDKGAEEAIKERHSLYAVGVCSVAGAFHMMEAVKIVNQDNIEIGVGISNYSSSNLKKIIGKSSKEIFSLGLGSTGIALVIHENVRIPSDDAVISRRNIVVETKKPSAIGVEGRPVVQSSDEIELNSQSD